MRLSAIKQNLDDSLALLSDVIMRPRLDDKDIERKRGQWLASIAQEKARPNTLVRRGFTKTSLTEGTEITVDGSSYRVVFPKDEGP